MRQKAGIYCRGGIWYISSYSRPKDSGVWVSVDAPICLSASASHSEKGEAALTAIRASAQGTDLPSVKDPAAALLKAAGLTSFTQFAKGALSIDVSLENGKLSITPQKNSGSRRGFEWLTDKKIVLDANASVEQIGATLEEAFLGCE